MKRQVDLLSDAQVICDTLMTAGVRFGIFSGMHVSLLTQHRATSDVDIWADHRKRDVIMSLFPEGVIVPPLDNEPTSLHMTLGPAHEVEIVADGGLFCMTKLMSSRLEQKEYGDFKTWFVAPEDTVIFKALKQRGPKQGKHDLEDIRSIQATISLDQHYIQARARQQKIAHIVLPVLASLNVLSSSDVVST